MLISRDILIRTLVLLVFTYVHKTRTTTNSRTAPANRTTSKSTLPTHTRTPRAPVSLGRDVKSEASLPAPRHGHALSSGEGTFRPVLTRLREGRAQDAKKKTECGFSTQPTPHKACQRRLRFREIGRGPAASTIETRVRRKRVGGCQL